MAAVEHWIRVGAPDASAPYELLGQVDAGAVAVELSAGELAALQAALSCTFGVDGLPAPTELDTQALIDRGVLQAVSHGPVLAPSSLRTVAFAAWGSRSISVSEGDGDATGQAGAGAWTVRYALVGRRGVELVRLGDGLRLTAVDSEVAADRVAALVDRLVGPEAPREAALSLDLSWSHDAGPDAPPEQREESLHLAVDAGEFRWSSVRAGQTSTESLTREQAASRLRQAVARGEATDLQRAADVADAEHRTDRAIGNRNPIAGIALDTLWPGLGGGRSTDFARGVRLDLLNDYWDLRGR